MYPFLAIISAISIYTTFNFLIDIYSRKGLLKIRLLPWLLLIVVFFFPYRQIFIKTIKSAEKDNMSRMDYFLMNAKRSNFNIDRFNLIVENSYEPVYLFYKNKLHEEGICINMKYFNKIIINDLVFTNRDNLIKYIESNYSFEKLYNIEGISFYRIIGKK